MLTGDVGQYKGDWLLNLESRNCYHLLAIDYWSYAAAAVIIGTNGNVCDMTVIDSKSAS